MFKLIAVLFLLVIYVLRCTSAQTCFCKSGSTFIYECYGPSSGKPCGPPSDTGFVQCCAEGDVCGANGFCHFTHPQDWSSGYYQGACTDPSFQDPSCPQHCTDLPHQDAIYSSSPPLWTCCLSPNGQANCSQPSNETWWAPTPQELFATPFSILTATGSTSTQNISTSTPTSGLSTTSSTSNALQTAKTTPASSSSNLGTEAKIGIGLGVFLASIIGFGAPMILIRRRSYKCQFIERFGSEQDRVTVPRYEVEASQRLGELSDNSRV